jgi:superfamily II DNA or RNA helicase
MDYPNTQKNIGFILEDKINKLLYDLNIFDNIFTEKKIVKIYGKSMYGIDHLAIINNKIITIQDKWASSAPEISHIHKFINTSEEMIKKLGNNTELLCGIFLSKIKMTKTGYDIMSEIGNSKYPSKKYYNISLLNANLSDPVEDQQNTLVKKLEKFIINILTTRGLYKINEIKNYKLRDDQMDDIRKFREKLLDNNTTRINCGIISKPTGTGKSITAFGCIGEYMITYPDSILWITERIDVLKSKFDDTKKLDMCIKMGIIQSYDLYDLLICYNDNLDIDNLNKKLSKRVFMITNTASILYNKRYKNILLDKFGMIIMDESHWAGANDRYQFLEYTKNNWTNLKCILGFSATPIRDNKENIHNIKKIFGDGTNINFISVMTFLDAINSGIIVAPDYYWIDTKLDKKISYQKYKKQIAINIGNYKIMLEHIDKLLGMSYTNKGVFWSQRVENAKNWKQIFEDCKNDIEKYPNISQYKFFITYSQNNKNGSQLDQFLHYRDKCVLIAVEQGKEGFDDSRIDICGNLEPVFNRSSVKSQQQIGRSVRKYKQKEKSIVFDCFCFEDDDDQIRNFINMICDYIILVKNINIIDPFFDPNKEYDKLKKIITYDKDHGKIKILVGVNKEIIFNISDTILKYLEWKNIPDMINEEIKQNIYVDGITCKIAMDIIKKHKIEFNDKEDYLKLCELDNRLPVNPFLTFHDFPGWIEYLNIDRSKYYQSVDECQMSIKQIIRENNNEINEYINSYDKIYRYCRTIDKLLPPLICDFFTKELKDLSIICHISIKKIDKN